MIAVFADFPSERRVWDSIFLRNFLAVSSPLSLCLRFTCVFIGSAWFSFSREGEGTVCSLIFSGFFFSIVSERALPLGLQRPFFRF